MDLIIHDAKLKKVAYIDNELQDTLSFYDDKWSRYLDTASSTFEFTVYKNGIKSDTVKEKAYQTLTERSFVSFKYNKKTYLFNVMRTEETEDTIRCYCENLNLELLNEMAGPYKATTEMSFVEYCNKFFLLIGGAITIGHNEIEDRERTLEWTGTDTKLKRLLSIANQFDAEIEFETILDEDSSLKSFILHVYKENDDKNQGVGKVRDDIVLRYGHNIEGVKRTIDKTGIFNMITPIGRATVEETVTKPNSKYVAPQVGTVTYSGGGLSNGGRTISKSLVNEILNLCVQHKLLPSGVFSQMYLESFWGNSPVARADNNWGGLTWAGSGNRPSGIKVTQGTARPANEGGYYMHFSSVSDYFKDYTYMLAEQGIYKVKGANNINDYTKGLFRYGGASYDYAIIQNNYTSQQRYNHYVSLMRSISSGINSASNGAMDTLDNQFKTAGTVGTAPVSQIATKTKDALAQLGAIKGQRVGSGQCYGLVALYSLKLGGAGLGGGVTGLRGLIRGGAAASNIGEDYNWSQFGWKVVRPSEVKHLIPGSIANIRANAGSPVMTGGWGHTVVIKGLSGDTLTVYEQNYANRQFVEERTYSASAYLRVIQTLVYPPEIVQGKRVDGTESAPTPSGTTGNNEPKTISETQQQEKTVGIPTDLYREWKNEEGVVEFYIKNGSIYAPISKELYPSAFSGEEISDNWIKKSVEYETIDVEKIISYSLQDIRKNCYPSISYEVKGTDENLDMGDTVKIDDEEFPDGLVLSARVSEQHISFTNDGTNETVFDNYKALKNKLSKDLIDRSAELAEQAKPFELRLLTDKGTQFKNSTGLSVLTAELWKSNKQYDATFQFRNFDTLLASGLTYTADGSTIPIDKPFLVSVDAFIGNDLVATRQITFTNINDGKDGLNGVDGLDGPQGLPGPKGADGLSSYTHIAYASKSKNILADAMVNFATYGGYQGSVVNVVKNSASYDVTTTGGTQTMKQIISINGTSGKSVWYYVKIKNTGTNALQLIFNGIGATSTTSFPTVTINPGATYTKFEQGICRNSYDFIQMNIGSMAVDKDLKYTVYDFAIYNEVPFINFVVGVNTNGEYVGMYQDFTAQDSTDPAKYNWSLIKGADGAQGIAGPAGADGKTPYWHTAYANSADGKTDFSLTVSDGKRYIGQYTDYTSADSTDPTKYKWVDMVGSVELGNRNFLASKHLANNVSSQDFTIKAWAQELVSSANLPNILQSGQTYTVSFDAEIVGKSTVSTIYSLQAGFAIHSPSNAHPFTTLFLQSSKKNAIQALNEKGRFELTFVCPNLATDSRLLVYSNRYVDGTTSDLDTVRFTNVNLTLGNVVSKSWIQPIEDIDAKIDTKADSELTQDQLNLLLETQNLMTAEMKTKATAEEADSLMSTVNQILADQAIAGKNTESALIENAQRIEAFRKDFDDKMVQLDFVSNYMRVTELGFEISANDGSSSLLIQKDRISMLSAGKEVMYISQGLIHIDNGVFTKTLQIGNFRESQLDGDPTTNVTIYVG